MNESSRAKLRLALRLLAVCGALAAPGGALAQVTVNVGSVQKGLTPRAVGSPFGVLAGSSDWGWIAHSEINGVRVNLDLAGQNSMPIDAAATSRQQFIWLRQDTRTEINDGPLGNGISVDCNAVLTESTASNYIDWPHYFGQLVNYSVMFDKAAGTGVEPIIRYDLEPNWPLNQAGLPDQTNPDYWWLAWYHWRETFAIAYMLASKWDITTFQTFNEPNIPSSSPRRPAPLFVEDLRIAADAIQLAIKTVNKRRTRCGQPLLAAKILAPTAAGTPEIYGGGSDAWLAQPEAPLAAPYYCNPAGENPTVCFGRYVLKNRTQSSFYGYSLSAADSFPTLFQGYSFHRYNSETEGELNMRDVWSYLRLFPGSPPAMDQYITETNIYAKATWPSSLTPDMPGPASSFARMLIRHARANANDSDPAQASYKNLYIQKFQSGDGQKTGIYHTSDATGEMSAPTLMAEVLRLYAHGFKGARARFDATTNDSNVEALAAYDAGVFKSFHVMITNKSTSAKAVTLDLSSFGTAIASSLHYRIQGVSAALHSYASTGIMTNRVLPFAMSGQSVVLVTVPVAAPTLRVINASHDATVKGGSNRSTNYGSSSDLYAAGNATSPDGRNVTLLRFQVPDNVYWARIRFALLKVHGQARTTGGTVGTRAIAHVYGIADDSWSEDTVTGSNAPNLDFHDGPMTAVAHNLVRGHGETAHIAGSLTGLSTAGTIMVDVTRYLKSTDRSLSLLITREVRFDPDVVSSGLADEMTTSTRSLWMSSSEGPAAQAPQLLIATSE
jgi:hypothetical protein